MLKDQQQIIIAMSSGQRYASTGLNFVLLLVFGFAIMKVTWSYEETCVDVKNQAICYLNGGEAESDWDSARQLCNSRNAALPDIRNINEQDIFAKFLNERMPGSIVWTSGRSHTYGDWTWVDGRRYSGKDAAYLSTIRERYLPVLDFDLDIRDMENPEYPIQYICQYSRSLCHKFNGTQRMKKGCIIQSDDQLSWYDARNRCLLNGGDLAVDLSYDSYSKVLRGFAIYSWIGLRKTSWRWSSKANVNEEDEIKWTNWSDDWNPLTGECISIDASNGKWKAIGCSEKLRVVCQRDFVNKTSSQFNSCEVLLSASFQRESQSVTYATFISVVMVGICIIIISNVIVALVVRKRVGLHQNSHVVTRSETTESNQYQDLETTRKQTKQESIYAELQLQPEYEEVCRRRP